MTAQEEKINLHSWAGAQMLLGQKLHDAAWYDWNEIPDDIQDKIKQALADRDHVLAGRIMDLAYNAIAVREVYAETGILL